GRAIPRSTALLNPCTLRLNGSHGSYAVVLVVLPLAPYSASKSSSPPGAAAVASLPVAPCEAVAGAGAAAAGTGASAATLAAGASAPAALSTVVVFVAGTTVSAVGASLRAGLPAQALSAAARRIRGKTRTTFMSARSRSSVEVQVGRQPVGRAQLVVAGGGAGDCQRMAALARACGQLGQQRQAGAVHALDLRQFQPRQLRRQGLQLRPQRDHRCTVEHPAQAQGVTFQQRQRLICHCRPAQPACCRCAVRWPPA